GRGAWWPGMCGRCRHPTARAMIPTGTLTRNTHLQLMATSRPPTTGPRAAATPPVAVQVRTALLRPSGGNDARTRLREVGVRRAAQAACTRRNATSIPTLVEAAQAAEAAVKMATPNRN